MTASPSVRFTVYRSIYDILSMIAVIDVFEAEYIRIEKIIFWYFNSDGWLESQYFSCTFDLNSQPNIYFDTLNTHNPITSF